LIVAISGFRLTLPSPMTVMARGTAGGSDLGAAPTAVQAANDAANSATTANILILFDISISPCDLI
jgi:hypothetical protein